MQRNSTNITTPPQAAPVVRQTLTAAGKMEAAGISPAEIIGGYFTRTGPPFAGDDAE